MIRSDRAPRRRPADRAQRRLLAVGAGPGLGSQEPAARLGRGAPRRREGRPRAGRGAGAVSVHRSDRHHADRHPLRRGLGRGSGRPPRPDSDRSGLGQGLGRHIGLHPGDRRDHLPVGDHRRTGPQAPRLAQPRTDRLHGGARHAGGLARGSAGRVAPRRFDAGGVPADRPGDRKRERGDRGGDP